MEAQGLNYGNTIQVMNQSGQLVFADISEVNPTGAYVDIDNNHIHNDDFNPIILTEELLLRCGFEKLPHFTVSNSMRISIGRNRELSIGCVGTPNEIIFIQEINATDSRKIDDLICLWNYVYDGELFLHTLQNIFHSFTGTELHYSETA